MLTKNTAIRDIFLVASTAISLILFATTLVSALGITAGTVKITVSPGSTNGSSFGLLNNGNESITVSLRVEGDAAPYIEVPATVQIPAGEMVYVEVEAAVPSSYSGDRIVGTVYAIQEGQPGQVKINIQAKKTVEITIIQQGAAEPAAQQSSGQSQQTGAASQPSTAHTETTAAAAITHVNGIEESDQQTQTTDAIESNSITGFASAPYPSMTYLIISTAVVISAVSAFFLLKRFGNLKIKRG